MNPATVQGTTDRGASPDPELRAWLVRNGVAANHVQLYEHARALIWGGEAQNQVVPGDVEHAIRSASSSATQRQLDNLRSMGDMLVRYYQQRADAVPAPAPSPTAPADPSPSPSASMDAMESLVAKLEGITAAEMVEIDDRGKPPPAAAPAPAPRRRSPPPKPASSASGPPSIDLDAADAVAPFSEAAVAPTVPRPSPPEPASPRPAPASPRPGAAVAGHPARPSPPLLAPPPSVQRSDDRPRTDYGLHPTGNADRLRRPAARGGAASRSEKGPPAVGSTEPAAVPPAPAQPTPQPRPQPAARAAGPGSGPIPGPAPEAALEVDWGTAGLSQPSAAGSSTQGAAPSPGSSSTVGAAASGAAASVAAASVAGASASASAVHPSQSNLASFGEPTCSCAPSKRLPQAVSTPIWTASFAVSGVAGLVLWTTLGLFGVLTLMFGLAAVSALAAVAFVRLRCRTCARKVEPIAEVESRAMSAARFKLLAFATALGVGAAITGYLRWGSGGSADGDFDADELAAEALDQGGVQEAADFLDSADGVLFEWNYPTEATQFVDEAYAHGASDVQAVGIETLGDTRVTSEFVIELPTDGDERDAFLRWCDDDFPGLCQNPGKRYVYAVTD